ncbi:Z1 domain-containing protein [Pseudarthrobacter sp. Fe7]|nr:Z1 domain-containing protein [Pseudarthrobacter sp. Fe7]
MRAYLVAGAIRLDRAASGKLGPHSAARVDFASREDALAAGSEPHSMLFHPSADIDGHFRGAEDVLLWAGISDRTAARELLESGDARLPASLVNKMLKEQSLWAVWLDKYRRSLSEISTEFNVLNVREVPDWPTVRDLLATEIIPGTRVSVVNSDPTADDRPEYKPSFDETTGRWRAARDLSTIFVSGNVMARGLTLEGMTTALFQRGSGNPLADTQMQMQRWFGYRGPHIELCRLFATRSQIDLFRAYHDIDESVRVAISEAMEGDAPDPVVLHGLQFLATGKIANLGRKPLCPSSKPFVTLINDGSTPDPNARSSLTCFQPGILPNLLWDRDREGARSARLCRWRRLRTSWMTSRTTSIAPVLITSWDTFGRSCRPASRRSILYQVARSYINHLRRLLVRHRRCGKIAPIRSRLTCACGRHA